MRTGRAWNLYQSRSGGCGSIGGGGGVCTAWAGGKPQHQSGSALRVPCEYFAVVVGRPRRWTGGSALRVPCEGCFTTILWVVVEGDCCKTPVRSRFHAPCCLIVRVFLGTGWTGRPCAPATSAVQDAEPTQTWLCLIDPSKSATQPGLTETTLCGGQTAPPC
jgi:hypothetical protein